MTDQQKPERSVTLKLTYKDLYFISESIGVNIPSSDDMTPDEKATYDKISSAFLRVAKDKL